MPVLVLYEGKVLDQIMKESIQSPRTILGIPIPASIPNTTQAYTIATTPTMGVTAEQFAEARSCLGVIRDSTRELNDYGYEVLTTKLDLVQFDKLMSTTIDQMLANLITNCTSLKTILEDFWLTYAKKDTAKLLHATNTVVIQFKSWNGLVMEDFYDRTGFFAENPYQGQAIINRDEITELPTEKDPEKESNFLFELVESLNLLEYAIGILWARIYEVARRMM